MRKTAFLSSVLILFQIFALEFGTGDQYSQTFVGVINAQDMNSSPARPPARREARGFRLAAVGINESTPEPDLVSDPAVEEAGTKSEYEEKLRGYTQKIEDYRRAHDVYRVTRAQYIRSKTQKAKTDAKGSTIKLLELRDDVIISYLKVLKARLSETEGVSDARFEGLAFKIDEEIFWYERHRNLVASAGSLEDLVDDSDEAKDRQKITERLYYEVLSNISYGKVSNYKERLKENLESLREKVDEIRVDERVGFSFSNRKMQVLDRWIFEAENLIIRTQDKQEETDDAINDMLQNKRQLNKVKPYNEIMEVLSDGKQFLKEASSYLIEVIKEIKIAEY